jgi:hypothetical protein
MNFSTAAERRGRAGGGRWGRGEEEEEEERNDLLMIRSISGSAQIEVEFEGDPRSIGRHFTHSIFQQRERERERERERRKGLVARFGIIKAE